MTAPPNAVPPAAKRMSLASVKRGTLDASQRILLYGPEGVGKTTWAAGAPSPVLIPVEEGSNHIDVPRFPRPETWAELLEAIDALTKDPHDYRTVILDTADWIEPLIFAEVIRDTNSRSRNRAERIEEVGGGYGKGMQAALDFWRIMLARLDALRSKRGTTVILLAHAHVKTYENPEGANFDKYQLKLAGKGASAVLKEWSDHVLFARIQVFARGGDDNRKGKGVTNGSRVIHTTPAAAYDAKHRGELPPEIPLTWEDFAAALAAGKPGDAGRLYARCEEVLPQVADETVRAQAVEVLARAKGNPSHLAKLLDRLTAQVAIAAAQGGAS